jgi:prolyl-tRNA editing enzyme YbaK/EbsC (Cys-tRNA(Pro) deacylase)
MPITLGTLKIVSLAEGETLLGSPVLAALSAMPDTAAIGVTEIDAALSDTAAFCAHYQVGMDQAANCVVLEAKRADRTWLAACVILGSMRADINGVARRTLDARRVSFAPMEQAVTETGMEYGAITPVGLPAAWPILIDKAVIDSPYVIIGSGIRKSKLAVPGSFLASLPNAQVVEWLARTPPTSPRPASP